MNKENQRKFICILPEIVPSNKQRKNNNIFLIRTKKCNKHKPNSKLISIKVNLVDVLRIDCLILEEKTRKYNQPTFSSIYP